MLFVCYVSVLYICRGVVVCSPKNSFASLAFFFVMPATTLSLPCFKQTNTLVLSRYLSPYIYASTSSNCHTGGHYSTCQLVSINSSCVCLGHWQTDIQMTRLQFVLVLCMVIIMDSEAGAQYVNGTGVSTCPPQFELILNYAACEAASTDVGYSFGGEEKTNRMYLLPLSLSLTHTHFTRS